MHSNLNFIRQQGFRDATAAGCDVQFRALMWQPRVIFVLGFLGLLFETGWYWAGLGLVLCGGALAPRRNLFDLAYNALIAPRRGLAPVPPAPAPRRVSMALGGTLALAIGVSMLAGAIQLAWHLVGIFFLAVGLLVFGRFCLGSYLFHVVTGQGAFAHRTMPWSRGTP